jgi:hypothetical protein
MSCLWCRGPVAWSRDGRGSLVPDPYCRQRCRTEHRLFVDELERKYHEDEALQEEEEGSDAEDVESVCWYNRNVSDDDESEDENEVDDGWVQVKSRK